MSLAPQGFDGKLWVDEGLERRDSANSDLTVRPALPARTDVSRCRASVGFRLHSPYRVTLRLVLQRIDPGDMPFQLTAKYVFRNKIVPILRLRFFRLDRFGEHLGLQ
jgi:hypothetical protein